MNLSGHLTAGAITIVALIVFLILRPVMEFQFGVRTYWPAFVCLYIAVWYYTGLRNYRKGQSSSHPGRSL